jgi:hypothetical protein
MIKKNINSSILILDRLDKKIKFKRIFFLIAKKNAVRGDHAHKKCIQAFFSIKGTFHIECIYQNEKRKKIIIRPGKKLEVIESLTWVKVHLKKNNICGILCDRYYEEKDYLRDFKKFKSFK